VIWSPFPKSDLLEILEDFGAVTADGVAALDRLLHALGRVAQLREATISNELATISNELVTISNELATISNELATISNELAVCLRSPCRACSHGSFARSRALFKKAISRGLF
jgi:cob(I)alamin adenosyltransferase